MKRIILKNDEHENLSRYGRVQISLHSGLRQKPDRKIIHVLSNSIHFINEENHVTLHLEINS